MSAGTESLIRAIQTNDPLAFYGWLHTLKGTPDLDAGVAGDPGITALAVASLMYSKAIQSDPVLATRYAAMIEVLMDAGANPLVQIGERFVVRRGTTGSWSGDGWTKAERWRRSAGRSLPGDAGMVWTPTGRQMVQYRASSPSSRLRPPPSQPQSHGLTPRPAAARRRKAGWKPR